MELPDLAGPPPSAEPLGQVEVSHGCAVTAGELTLTLESHFTPERVGVPAGTRAVVIFGQFEAERQHPGDDYQSTELGTYFATKRVRLGRYRWLLSNISLEPPCVTVTVERVAAAPKRLAPALATNEECTFWLSTLGVDDLELETRGNPLLPTYGDYVEVSVWSYEQQPDRPWAAVVRARRELFQYDTARWEHQLELGQTHAGSVNLGDHKLELVEVVWVKDSVADLHAHFRLSRGVTAEGMTRSPPPKPFVPHVRR